MALAVRRRWNSPFGGEAGEHSRQPMVGQKKLAARSRAKRTLEQQLIWSVPDLAGMEQTPSQRWVGTHGRIYAQKVDPRSGQFVSNEYSFEDVGIFPSAAAIARMIAA